MEISGINQGQRALPQQLPRPAFVPTGRQAPVALDRLQLKSPLPTLPKGVTSDKRLGDLSPQELSSLGGGSSLETLAGSRGNLTVGEAMPLIRNKPALESISNLLAERSDLKVSDFVSRDIRGRVRIDPTHKDPEAMQFLKERQDISPSEVSAMRADITRQMRNPRIAKMATSKGLELLKTRSDVKPDDVAKMMDSFTEAVGMKDRGQASRSPDAGPMAALDMMDNASKLLGKRTDIHPDQVGELAQAVGGLGSKKDEGRASRVSQGFEAATKALTKNSLRNPQEMVQLTDVVKTHFPGNDEKAAGHRMQAFQSAANMLGEHPQTDSRAVDNMLNQAVQSDPKLRQGSKAQQAAKLGRVLSSVEDGLKQGTVSPSNLSAQFQSKGSPKAAQKTEATASQKQSKSEQTGAPKAETSKANL